MYTKADDFAGPLRTRHALKDATADKFRQGLHAAQIALIPDRTARCGALTHAPLYTVDTRRAQYCFFITVYFFQLRTTARCQSGAGRHLSVVRVAAE
jgi:hypothetical protein